MKKFILFLFIMLILPNFACASEKSKFNYKNIKQDAKITYSDGKWSNVKKSDEYFVKKQNAEGFYEYYDKNGEIAFTTECEFEFLTDDGRFIGYSNADFAFYEFIFKDGNFEKTKLTKEETELLLPDYRVITTDEFSPYTNVFKLKWENSRINIIVYNDNDKNLDGYVFYSPNAKIITGPIAGTVTVLKPCMIQFSKNGEESSKLPWYVLIVR